MNLQSYNMHRNGETFMNILFRKLGVGCKIKENVG
jgi:hypothetical protein